MATLSATTACLSRRNVQRSNRSACLPFHGAAAFVFVTLLTCSLVAYIGGLQASFCG